MQGVKLSFIASGEDHSSIILYPMLAFPDDTLEFKDYLVFKAVGEKPAPYMPPKKQEKLEWLCLGRKPKEKKEKYQIMDTSSPEHTAQIYNAVRWARSNVLVYGIGLGYLAASLAARRSVTKITVLEPDEELAGFIWGFWKDVITTSEYQKVKFVNKFQAVSPDQDWVIATHEEIVALSERVASAFGGYIYFNNTVKRVSVPQDTEWKNIFGKEETDE